MLSAAPPRCPSLISRTLMQAHPDDIRAIVHLTTEQTMELSTYVRTAATSRVGAALAAVCMSACAIGRSALSCRLSMNVNWRSLGDVTVFLNSPCVVQAGQTLCSRLSSVPGNGMRGGGYACGRSTVALG